MTATPYLDFYQSNLQSVYALCVPSLVFLAWLAWSPAAREQARSGEPWRRFLHGYCLVFGIETILDPIATGPFVRWLGVGDSPLGTAIPLAFVLLGDFRVYLLIFSLAAMAGNSGMPGAAQPARPGATPTPALLESAGWTLIVPVVAYTLDSALQHANPALPEQTIWLVYELAFLGIAIWLRARGIPRRVPASNSALRQGLQAVAAYAAVYYALWATADIVIMAFGLDLGWALRVIPNQLYYAFYLPFVYFVLTSRRPTS